MVRYMIAFLMGRFFTGESAASAIGLRLAIASAPLPILKKSRRCMECVMGESSRGFWIEPNALCPCFRKDCKGRHAIIFHMILTDEQRKELAGPHPIRVIDPKTKQEYVLVPADLCKQVRPLAPGESAETPLPQVAPSVQRSQEAFLRDL